jgi:hypothetical protein
MRPDVLLTMLADIIALGMLDEIRWVAYVPAEYLEAAYTRAVTPQFTPSAKWPFFAAATPSSSDESDADEEMGGEFTSSSIPSTSRPIGTRSRTRGMGSAQPPTKTESTPTVPLPPKKKARRHGSTPSAVDMENTTVPADFSTGDTFFYLGILVQTCERRPDKNPGTQVTR